MMLNPQALSTPWFPPFAMPAMPENWTPSDGAMAPVASSPNDGQNAGYNDPTATAAGMATATPTATAGTPATAPVHDANMTRSAAGILERTASEGLDAEAR